jgi:nicotinamide riboside transporter PnuC
MNVKIIGKVAAFFGIVSTVFVVLSATITYYLLQIASPNAPSNYVAFYVLSTLLPYLFLAVLSTVIAVLFWSLGKEKLEKEELPQAQTTLNS